MKNLLKTPFLQNTSVGCFCILNAEQIGRRYASEKTNDIRNSASEAYLEPSQKSTSVLFEAVNSFRKKFYVKKLTGFEYLNARLSMSLNLLQTKYWHISAQCCILYINQSFDLHCKSNDWFLQIMQHWAEMD